MYIVYTSSLRPCRPAKKGGAEDKPRRRSKHQNALFQKKIQFFFLRGPRKCFPGLAVSTILRSRTQLHTKKCMRYPVISSSSWKAVECIGCILHRWKEIVPTLFFHSGNIIGKNYHCYKMSSICKKNITIVRYCSECFL